jgi:hypothetical protein
MLDELALTAGLVDAAADRVADALKDEGAVSEEQWHKLQELAGRLSTGFDCVSRFSHWQPAAEVTP